MQTLTFYFTYANSDTNSGGGPSFRTPYVFHDRHSAEQFVCSPFYAHHYGVQRIKGNPEYDVKKETFYIFESTDSFLTIIEDLARVEIRKNALRKLSSEEKQVLGLKE